ncbi:MFS transporter [Telmatospirillum sp.]|uniref:MFS transporter n=1 Tax=Telmatospirillum sp. TaxID=2079197 RepID=UPI002846C0B4|nr:MFS transporter [Telmatospirillum sp.]MDR3437382.1 MFS transporter [Telmatospirillum sp.]
MTEECMPIGAEVLSRDEEDSLYRKVVFRIVPLFFLGFIVSYLDRVNIGFAKLQMSADFGLSNASFAFGASVFFWAYMLFEIPSNLILQKVGARLWIARIMITWGIVSMLMIFSKDEKVFYTLRFLLGVCEAGFVPGVMYYTNSWLPTKRQSGMYSLFLMALPVAVTFGAPISGGILDFMQGVGGLKGWHWLFILEGLPSIILGLVIIALLRNKPADVKWLTEREKRIIEGNVKIEAAHKLTGIGQMLKCGKIYLLIITMIMFNTGFYGLTFWMPTLFKMSGIASDFQVGLLTAIPFGVAAISMRCNALHSEKTGERRLHGTIAVLLAAIGLFLATCFSQYFVFSLVMLTIATSGILSLMPMYWTLPGRLLAGPACAAGLALINSCGSLSGILGALIIGQAGMQIGLYILASFLLVCAVLFYLVCPAKDAFDVS